MKNARTNQRAAILGRLLRAGGGEVPLPELTRLAAQYNSRLHELRRLGFRIPPPRIETVAGKRHTWYRIELTAPIGNKSSPPPQYQMPGATLFGDLAPDRTYRE